jgi:hypothetical protein
MELKLKKWTSANGSKSSVNYFMNFDGVYYFNRDIFIETYRDFFDKKTKWEWGIDFNSLMEYIEQKYEPIDKQVAEYIGIEWDKSIYIKKGWNNIKSISRLDKPITPKMEIILKERRIRREKLMEIDKDRFRREIFLKMNYKNLVELGYSDFIKKIQKDIKNGI